MWMMSLGVALWELLAPPPEGLRVTHMFYADDLTLTANDPVQLQEMLRRPESYAARKELTVNVQKSYLFMCTGILQFLLFVSTFRSSKSEIFYLPGNGCRLFTLQTFCQSLDTLLLELVSSPNHFAATGQQPTCS